MSFESCKGLARRFFPNIFVKFQSENGSSSGMSRKDSSMMVASDHLLTYSPHNLRRSSRSQWL